MPAISERMICQDDCLLLSFCRFQDNDECLRNETRHKQPENSLGNREKFPTLCQNFVNFGP